MDLDLVAEALVERGLRGNEVSLTVECEEHANELTAHLGTCDYGCMAVDAVACHFEGGPGPLPWPAGCDRNATAPNGVPPRPNLGIDEIARMRQGGRAYDQAVSTLAYRDEQCPGCAVPTLQGPTRLYVECSCDIVFADDPAAVYAPPRGGGARRSHVWVRVPCAICQGSQRGLRQTLQADRG